MADKNRRKKALRNYHSYFERRKPIKNGGYHEDQICPRCGRAIVTGGNLCHDCRLCRESLLANIFSV